MSKGLDKIDLGDITDGLRRGAERCTTHHHACDCRELYCRRLQEGYDDMVKILRECGKTQINLDKLMDSIQACEDFGQDIPNSVLLVCRKIKETP